MTMKFSTKALKKLDAKTAPAPLPAKQGVPVRRWLLLGACLLVAAGATWAVMEFFVWDTVPKELIGKWVVTEGPDKGGTIDFYRGGKMVAVVNFDGQKGVIEAKIRVEDGKIFATIKKEKTGELGTRVQTIKVLDETRLVLEDERGHQIKLVRAE
jgi:uncharacterized protein (TIGR03066 family)